MRLEDIKCGQILTGIEQGNCCEVIALQLIGKNSATLYYKRDGVPQERMLTRIDEPNISIADSGRPLPTLQGFKQGDTFFFHC